MNNLVINLFSYSLATKAATFCLLTVNYHMAHKDTNYTLVEN